MRVGVNLHRNAPDVEAALMAIRPGIIVTSAPDWGVLERVKAAYPDTMVIYRWMADGDYDNVGASPETVANGTLEALHGHLNLVDAVCFRNEVITNANAVAQVEEEHSFVRLMHLAGIKVCALNAGVGQLDPEVVPLLINLWREADWVGYHGYLEPSADGIADDPTPYYFRRPEKLWLPTLRAHGLDLRKLIFTETGTYHAPIITWQSYGRLCCDINDYAMSIGARGTAAFTLSAQGKFSRDGAEPWELVGTEAVGVLAEDMGEEDMALTPAQLQEVSANLDILWGNTNTLEPVIKDQVIFEERQAIVAIKKAVGLQ